MPNLLIKKLTKTFFGESAFRRFIRGNIKDHDGVWESNKINRGLFDIIIFGFTQYEKHQVIPLADSIREELIWFFYIAFCITIYIVMPLFNTSLAVIRSILLAIIPTTAFIAEGIFILSNVTVFV